MRSRQRNSSVQHHQIFSALALLRIKIATRGPNIFDSHSTRKYFRIRLLGKHISNCTRVGSKFAIVNFPHSIILAAALRDEAV
jgi:hypothetical protein